MIAFSVVTDCSHLGFDLGTVPGIIAFLTL